MAQLKGLQKSQIDIDDLLVLMQDSTMSRINCHNVGKIIEFDATTQTCTVQLMQVKQFYDESFSPAPITDVPLLIYGNDKGNITLPDVLGTICLVLFLDRDTDAFMETGEQYKPDTTRTHDFSDCVAFTTFTTLANPIQNYDTESISINYQNIVSDILYYAFIKNRGDKITLSVKDEEETNVSNVDIDANNIEMSANNIELTATGGANVQLDTLVKIANTTTDLLTVMLSLIDTVKNITISSSTISNPSKIALENVATEFKTLLKGNTP